MISGTLALSTAINLKHNVFFFLAQLGEGLRLRSRLELNVNRHSLFTSLCFAFHTAALLQ